MKKLFLLLATAAVTSGAYAEGYQVNNLSSKQNGMGHVGTAMKLNSESIWFNPADTIINRNSRFANLFLPSKTEQISNQAISVVFQNYYICL